MSRLMPLEFLKNFFILQFSEIKFEAQLEMHKKIVSFCLLRHEQDIVINVDQMCSNDTVLG